MLSSRNWIVQFYLKILTSGKQNCFSFCGTSSFRPLTGAPPPEVPAHKALCTCISLSLGRLPDPSWKRRPGRPRGRWIDQFRRDNSQPPADLWRQAINRGHSGRATQRSSDYAATWPDLTIYSKDGSTIALSVWNNRPEWLSSDSPTIGRYYHPNPSNCTAVNIIQTRHVHIPVYTSASMESHQPTWWTPCRLLPIFLNNDVFVHHQLQHLQ